MRTKDIMSIFPDATDKQVSQMLDAIHVETDALRDEIDAVKGKLAESEKNADASATEWKRKYENERDSFERYKTEQTAKETRASKEKALKDLLADTGLSEKGREKAMKYADFDSIDLDDVGKIKDAGKLKKSISEEWAEYMTQTSTNGVQTFGNTGSKSGGKSMTREDILAIEDAGERQAAMAENHELFGF